jgi:hypothetical protein
MPSSTSFTLNLNFEPIVGSIEAIPSFGISLSTFFQIKIHDIKDDDFPITFKFYLYQEVILVLVFYIFSTLKKKKIK